MRFWAFSQFFKTPRLGSTEHVSVSQPVSFENLLKLTFLCREFFLIDKSVTRFLIDFIASWPKKKGWETLETF